MDGNVTGKKRKREENDGIETENKIGPPKKKSRVFIISNEVYEEINFFLSEFFPNSANRIKNIQRRQNLKSNEKFDEILEVVKADRKVQSDTNIRSLLFFLEFFLHEISTLKLGMILNEAKRNNYVKINAFFMEIIQQQTKDFFMSRIEGNRRFNESIIEKTIERSNQSFSVLSEEIVSNFSEINIKSRPPRARPSKPMRNKNLHNPSKIRRKNPFQTVLKFRKKNSIPMRISTPEPITPIFSFESIENKEKEKEEEEEISGKLPLAINSSLFQTPNVSSTNQSNQSNLPYLPPQSQESQRIRKVQKSVKKKVNQHTQQTINRFFTPKKSKAKPISKKNKMIPPPPILVSQRQNESGMTGFPGFQSPSRRRRLPTGEIRTLKYRKKKNNNKKKLSSRNNIIMERNRIPLMTPNVSQSDYNPSSQIIQNQNSNPRNRKKRKTIQRTSSGKELIIID